MKIQMPHRAIRQVTLMVLIAGAGALGATASAQAPQSGRQERAERFTFADSRVGFLAPPGFTALNAEWLAAKYPRAGAPRHAIGNTRRTTSVAYDLLDQRVPTNDPDAVRRALMEGYSQLPKLKWVASDVRRVGDRQWAYLEFTVAAADQDLHNIVLASVYDGRLLLFNFNSTVAEFPRVERALRASMATITTNP